MTLLPEIREELQKAAAREAGARSATKRSPLSGRVAGWSGLAIPALGVVTTIAVVVVALGALGRSHRPAAAPGGSGPKQTAPAGSGPTQTRTTQTLSASEYAFAVGGDVSSRTSRTQATSGLRLFRADQILAERCMRQRGFRYLPLPTPTTSDLPSVTGYPSTFYPQPLPAAYPRAALLALRQREGFGLVSSRRDPDPNDQYLTTLPPARQKLWRTAWIGHNGCYGTAEVQLFGSRQAASLEGQVPVKIYNYLNTIVYRPNGALSPSNPRTADAAAAWSRCMQTTTGHAWADENALISGLGNDYTGPSARALAVADTKCAYSTGQAQAFAAAFRQGATHLPVTIQADLRFLFARRHAWIKKANGILTSPTP